MARFETHSGAICAQQWRPSATGWWNEIRSTPRRVLNAFATLVREVRPALLLEGLIDLETLRRAHDALATVLRESEHELTSAETSEDPT